MTDFHGRHFLKELDFTPAEWLELLESREERRSRSSVPEEQEHCSDFRKDFDPYPLLF